MSERDSGKSLHTVAFFKCLLFSVSLSLPPIILCSQGQTSIPEETEWTREVGPQLADPKLPNVLLLGDSITRNYFSRT